jgi:hypothetical protein
MEIKKVDEKSKRRNIIDVVIEAFSKVCSESTCHALPNIFRTDNWIIRIFWLVLFLGGSGFALYCKKN